MKKLISTVLLIMSIANLAVSQGKYLTNEGTITFYSHATLEDITAINQEVAAVIDAASGEVAIIVNMTSFIFEKKLMQEHFNENYVESEKFPKATFTGHITNTSEVDYNTQGTYPVKVEGEMTIHGVKRTVNTEASVEVTGTAVIARAIFLLNPEDYGIEIPRVVRKNIAEQMEITVELGCSAI